MSATSTFNLKFTYVLPGWKGTTSDLRIMKNALRRQNPLKIPKDNSLQEKKKLPINFTNEIAKLVIFDYLLMKYIKLKK